MTGAIEVPVWALLALAFAIALGLAYRWGRWWIRDQDPEVAEAYELIDEWERYVDGIEAEFDRRYVEIVRLEGELAAARSELAAFREPGGGDDPWPSAAGGRSRRVQADPFDFTEVDHLPAGPHRRIDTDDLQAVDGIGPKIAAVLAANGIHSWAALAAAEPESLQQILAAAGPRYRRHDPSSWPEQARLLAEMTEAGRSADPTAGSAT